RPVLLQLAGSEGWRGTAAALFLLNVAHRPLLLLERGENFLGLFLVGNFRLLFTTTDKPGVEGGALAGMQVRVNGPVFLLIERLDLALALHDQTQSHGLHASGRKSAPDFVPQERRNLVADNAVQHAPRLLRIHQVAVDITRM